MSQPLQELLSLLQLEKLEEGLFRGQSENLGLPQVYGGQVLGQALSAARYTVQDDRSVHSFHSYFLFPGDPEKPIEMRPVTVVNPLKPKKTEAKQYLWVRANGALPDNQLIHQYLLAYASDWGFLVTALHPHEVSIMTPNFQVATIDHSIWFHRPFKMDEWLLYAIESPTAANTRGLVRGEIFNQKGELVATAVQEGVMRFTK